MDTAEQPSPPLGLLLCLLVSLSGLALKTGHLRKPLQSPALGRHRLVTKCPHQALVEWWLRCPPWWSTCSVTEAHGEPSGVPWRTTRSLPSESSLQPAPLTNWAWHSEVPVTHVWRSRQPSPPLWVQTSAQGPPCCVVQVVVEGNRLSPVLLLPAAALG